jgi:hypothetical protein
MIALRLPTLPCALLLASVCAVVGCADARGRFDDFQNRLHAEPDSGTTDGSADGADSYLEDDGGPCTPPDPNVVAGPALLALDSNFIPGNPVLFLGTIDTPALDGTTAVHFVYHALDASNRRTLVGPGLEVGPFALQDGVLVAPIPESTLDGDANPQFYGMPVTSEMTLTGRICGVHEFYCGTLAGDVSGGISGPLTGHFGITLLDGPTAVPDRPRFGCDPMDIGPSLAADAGQQ